MSFSLFRFALFVVMLPVSSVDVFVGVFLSSRCLLLRFLLSDLCHVLSMASFSRLSTRPEVLFRASRSLFSLYAFVLINAYVVHRLNINMLTRFLPLLFAARLYQNKTVTPILNFNVNASDHVISSQVKIFYSRDHLLSLKNSISPISYSLCATISSLGIHASNHLCITRKSRKRHRRRRSNIGQIQQITVVPISSSRTPNPKTNIALNRANLINIPILQSFSESRFSNNSLRIGCFNARSIGPSDKRSEINHFIFDNRIDVFFLVETWLKNSGDEPKIADVTPIGYAARSFPRLNKGGGLAIIARSHILQHIAFKSSFSFEHHSFELFQATLSVGKGSVNFFCLYRPPPNRKNKLTDSLFVEQLSAFLEYCNSITGCLLILGDFNFHFDCPTDQHVSKNS